MRLFIAERVGLEELDLINLENRATNPFGTVPALVLAPLKTSADQVNGLLLKGQWRRAMDDVKGRHFEVIHRSTALL